MSWKPTLTWQDAQNRAKTLQRIRSFFADRNVVEVETPALSHGTVTDVYLDALSCRYNFLSTSSSDHPSTLFLQTSPEFHMKRLLAAGYGCIFQISKAFRHEESGRNHNPEFTMLEWYRLGFDHFDLMAEVGDLLKEILGCAQPQQVTYQTLFSEKVNIDPLSTNRTELLELIKKYGMLSDWLVSDSKNDMDNDILLQFVFTEIIEPTIGKNVPCFVYNFPKTQASLAKLSLIDERVAERFECYYQGIELVNGFHELTDERIQVERFQKDNLNRLAKGLPIKPIDMRFTTALTCGLPQCSGVALGIDRLIMLLLKAEHIEQVLSFPIERA